LGLVAAGRLAKLAGAAEGSGDIEHHTRELRRAAGTVFQKIEAAGGPAWALEQGLVQQEIAGVRAEREKAVATRNEVLTGTSKFPDIAEVPVSVLDVAPAPAAPTAGTVRFEPLPRIRLSEPYERLRAQSDRLLRDTGARPKVFLANLGPLAAFNARATWAKNFFEAGGIEAVTNEGFPKSPQGGTDLDALAAALRSSGAKLACICSSDEIY